MNLAKILTISVLLLFISITYNNFQSNSANDVCVSNPINLEVIALPLAVESPIFLYAHGGGLNKCGCHFNRKTNECHCHRNKGCGCECQPSSCN